MAPANATQSPPDLAALYVKLHQQDVAAAGIDRGLQGMAASFGTAQQQHDMMDAMRNIQPDDRAGMLGQIMKDQSAQQAKIEHNRFMAGAAGMASLLGPNVTPEQAAWLANDKDAFDEVMKTHLAAMAPTEAMKNADAATQAWAQMNPNATPQEIAAQKTKMLTGIIPGPAGEALKVQAKDAQEFKDNATADYSTVQNKLNDTENTINQLLKNPDATVGALKTPLPTTGTIGNLMPGLFVSQEEKNAAVLINKLKASFSADNLANVKNVRNQREFNTLAQAASGGLDAANSSDQIIQTLQTMKNKILDARATSEAAAGHHLTGELAGRANVRDLLNPSNPYYNGATEDKPAQGGGQQGGAGPRYIWDPKTGLQPA
jgi:hypothetical protein